MSDIDLHVQVLTALGELNAEQSATTAEVKNVGERLDKVNGSVAKRESRIGLLELGKAPGGRGGELQNTVALRLAVRLRKERRK